VDGVVYGHESFETAGMPQTEVIPGDTSYVIAEDGQGGTLASRCSYAAGVPSGSTVRRVASVNRDQIPRPRALNDFDFLNNPTGAYEVQEDDLLIIEAETAGLDYNSRLLGMLDLHQVLLHPASQPLPFGNGKSSGEGGQSLNYTVLGAITSDLKLISWATWEGGGQLTANLVDRCVVNAHIQNRTELTLLWRDISGASLIGTLDSNPIASAYLEYFDAARGTTYVPTVDPIHRFEDFPDPLTEDEISLTNRLADLVVRNS
jgi:hypothetical protein